MKTTTTEIAPDIFRICTFIPDFNLQFCQFLVRDEEPLLYHTGMNALFPLVRGAVSEVIDPTTLRWIAFSHFESDECGSLNQWLELAPNARAACSFVGAMVSVNDFASRPARALEHDEVFSTGERRFRFHATPQVPHCWEAGMLFEETTATLFCSDLFHQLGDVEASSDSADVVGRFRQAITEYQGGPFAGYLPYTRQTGPTIDALAGLSPRVIAPMHGSAYLGNGEGRMREMGTMLRETLGG
jgi:flavorubredoxin